MGFQSLVYGTIEEWGDNRESNRLAIAQFEFDDVYPFTNIFWSGSPAAYKQSVIGFAGSYKEIESDWNDWMGKFTQLLSNLEAFNTIVTLDGWRGHFTWRLSPLSWLEHLAGTFPEPPTTFKGEEWGIYEAPNHDFSLDPGFSDITAPGLDVPLWTTAESGE